MPLYPRVRRAQARRLAARFAASPFADRLTVGGYYRTRLGLLLHGLRHHGRPIPKASVEVQGESHYLEALAAGRPIALVGLHMGPVEILHRFPEAPEGRPFRIMTADAFAGPLTAFLRAGRERDGKSILPNLDLAAGLREVTARSGVLAFMADQVPGDPDAWLELWDRIRIPWPRRLLQFLRDREFLLLPVSTRLDGDGRPRYRFHPAWDGSIPAEHSLRAFLEEAIAIAPEQWNWSYPKLRIADGALKAASSS